MVENARYRRAEQSAQKNPLRVVMHGELDEANASAFVLDPQDPGNADVTPYGLQHGLQSGAVVSG